VASPVLQSIAALLIFTDNTTESPSQIVLSLPRFIIGGEDVRSTETKLSGELVTVRSGKLSPSTSPIFTSISVVPPLKSIFGAKDILFCVLVFFKNVHYPIN
jgi:hypothetical protein